MDKILGEQKIVDQLAQQLSMQDLETLSTINKTSHGSMASDHVWKMKTEQEFGDLFAIYHMFDATPVEPALDLAEKYSTPPLDWQHFYQLKAQRQKQHATSEELRNQVADEMQQALSDLDKCPEQGDILLFNHLVSRTLWILDLVPGHGPCYYILVKILYFLQHAQIQQLLQEGLRLDPDYLPLRQLKDTIDQEGWMTPAMHTQHPSQPQHDLVHPMSAAPSHTNTHHYGASPPTAFLNDTSDLSHYRRRSSVKVPLPVLDHDETALSEPLLGVLDALFAKYDVDHDQSLCPEELDAFVFATNGQHPGDEWLEAFSQRFGANESGWLTKDGFLAFYLEQTLGDQDETRKDIQAHGYDAYTLQPAHLP